MICLSCNKYMTDVKENPKHLAHICITAETNHMNKYHYCFEITGTFLFKLHI